MDHLAGVVNRPYARVIIAYDIADDDRRVRVADTLLDFLDRVQFSVFDGWLPIERSREPWSAASRALLSGKDEAFALVLCRACALDAGHLGQALQPLPPGTSWML